MTLEELTQLVRGYPEWEDDLDETACPTGIVSCLVCGGGGCLDKRTRTPPKHLPGCLRAKFEKEHLTC